MADPRLQQLLKWSVENSSASRTDPTSTVRQDPSRGLSEDAVKALFNGPSDAELMRNAMAAIQAPELDLQNKLTAFDNLEQLVENIDNANILEQLDIWRPLLGLLEHEEPQMRRMAAWCVATAVQNNEKAQGLLLKDGSIPVLVRMATEEKDMATRKKGILALSSAIRNHQPSMDEAWKTLPEGYKSGVSCPNAQNMEDIDPLIARLRESLAAS